MFIKYNLFIIFSAFSLASSIFVVWTKNPIFSVLFLIFTFFNVSALLFLFNFEFLPIAFLIIYVGAVAVLFLFVLMMLNIKLAELQENYSSLVPLTVIFSIIFLVEFILLFRAELPLINNVNEELFSFLFDIATTQKTNFTLLFGLAPNLKSIAMPLFADYLLCFILAGYILLLAMLAAIVLTIQKAFVSKSQNVYIQVMADYEKSIVNFF